MKKLYLLLLSVIFAAGLSAQSASIADQADLQNQNKSKESSTFSVQSQPAVGVVDVNAELPGFPVFVNTGDIEKDNATFQAARDQWMQNEKNKALYDQFLIRNGKVDIEEENSKQPK